MPVYTEEAALALSVRRLHRFLTAEFPFSWRIVIADNASVDLSTDLRALLPLVAPLLSGHSDIAIGPASRTARASSAAPSAS